MALGTEGKPLGNSFAQLDIPDPNRRKESPDGSADHFPQTRSLEALYQDFFSAESVRRIWLFLPCLPGFIDLTTLLQGDWVKRQNTGQPTYT